MEESAKVHQARSFMNLFRHMQFVCGFFKNFNAMQNLNILEIRTEWLVTQPTIFYVLKRQYRCDVGPSIIREGPPLYNLVFQNFLRSQREIKCN
jgi:hypothetical protein